MKNLMLIICLFLSVFANAQYSTKQLDEKFNRDTYYPVKPIIKDGVAINKITRLNIDSLLNIFNKEHRDKAVKELLQLRLWYMFDTVTAKKEFFLDSIDKKIVITKYQYKSNSRDLIQIKAFMDKGHPKFFLPAMNGRESLKFYENDSIHIQLFRNNSINYSPTNNQMILATEIINDYFGPIRIGFGFQIKSNAKTDSLSTVDSTMDSEKKLDLVADLKNKGGDINLNFDFPLMQLGSGSQFFSMKVSLFSNLGFSLPTYNEANKDFKLNNYGGINTAIYSGGFLDKLSILIGCSVGYVSGNKNFRKTIIAANKNDPTSFWFNKLSIGLDVNDVYRLQADLFGGNSFVRKNFPATITFTIRPDK